MKLPPKPKQIAGKGFKKQVLREVKDASVAERFNRWLRGNDTGASSIAIGDFMLGKKVSCSRPPSDAADFGRCYRLLKLFPEWRERLGEMKELSQWTYLINKWQELEIRFEKGELRGTLETSLWHEW